MKPITLAQSSRILSGRCIRVIIIDDEDDELHASGRGSARGGVDIATGKNGYVFHFRQQGLRSASPRFNGGLFTSGFREPRSLLRSSYQVGRRLSLQPRSPSPVSAFYWRIPPVFISVDWESFLPTVSLSGDNYALAIQSIVFSFLTLTRKPTFILRMPRGFRLLPPHKPGLCKWDPARSWRPL